MATLECNIEDLISPVLETLGYDLVRVRIIQAKSKILEIMIERLDGSPVSIEGCKEASSNISALLDVEEIITSAYSLEVCSAGVERPLVKIADYSRFIGSVAAFKLLKTYNDSKKLKGTILSVSDQGVIAVEALQGKEKVVTEVEYEDVRDAHLVLTDELYREILAKKV